MTTISKLPLIASPQTLTISLNGTIYNLTLSWCRPAQCWMLSIADVNSNPIVSSLPVVTGADLLEQFAYLDIGGQLVVQTDNNSDAVPTFTNLGIAGNIYFVTP